MTTEAVQFVIGKAVANEPFRKELARDPVWMLDNVKQRHGYDFTDEEVDAIKSMDWDGLEVVGFAMNLRMTRYLSMTSATCNCVPTPQK